MKNAVTCLIFALVVPLVLPFAAGADAPGQVKEFTATIDKDGVQRIAIVAGDFFFDPNYIIVKVNVPVELTVTKGPGLVSHDIVMQSPEAGIEFAADIADTPVTITFTPTRVGKYPIFCTKKQLFFPSHRDKGMEGTLDVRE